MQSKKRWLIPAAAAALIISGGTALAYGGYGPHDGQRCAQHSRSHGGHMGGQMGGQMGMRGAYRVSNLSDQQRAELDKVFDAAHDATYAKMKSWRTERRALRDAMRKGADPATIKPLAEKAGQHMAEMIVMRAETRAKVNAVLTPAQRAELQTLAHGGRGPHGRFGNTGGQPQGGKPGAGRP